MLLAENMMFESFPQSNTDQTLNLIEPAFSFFLIIVEDDTKYNIWGSPTNTVQYTYRYI